ncbi:MAG: tetratricopeptide repeat protein [Flavobacteriales bacterium]|nr:tetratricopeptide repeat protein [Flavobacteriales bacterium]
MSKKIKNQESTTEEVFKNLEETAGRSEQFVEKHKNVIIGAVLAVVVVLGGYMAFHTYYMEPMQKEATNELFNAKKYFEQDSLNVALKGDGQYMGFLDIANDYSMTKAGNLANYYAGVSYLKLGDFDNAITYLEKFSSDDKMVGPIAKGSIADAFVGLNQLDEALDYYQKAANANDNGFTSPLYLFKAGKTALSLNEFGKAQDLFEKIKSDYPKSAEAESIDKFIERAKAAEKNS